MTTACATFYSFVEDHSHSRDHPSLPITPSPSRYGRRVLPASDCDGIPLYRFIDCGVAVIITAMDYGVCA